MRALLKRVLFGRSAKPFRVLTGIGRGAVFHLDPATDTQRILGMAEREIAAAFAKLIRNCSVFCDVGASDGFYSILAGRLNPNCKIIACEPSPELGVKFHQNWALNRLDLTRVTHLAGYVGTDLSLDHLASGQHVLTKIDIEGCEVAALKSAPNLIKVGAPFLIETHSLALEREAVQLLEDNGYKCTIINRGWYRLIMPERRPAPHNRWLVATKDH